MLDEQPQNPQRPVCPNCLYYQANAAVVPHFAYQGTCRISPATSSSQFTPWPVVPVDGWCAAFRPLMKPLGPGDEVVLAVDMAVDLAGKTGVVERTGFLVYLHDGRRVYCKPEQLALAGPGSPNG